MNNILVMRLGALGDTLHTTPCLKALKEAYPNSKLTYIVGKGAEPVIENNPYIDKVVIFEKRGKHKTWAAQIRFALDLRRRDFHLVANMSPSMRTSIFSLLINGRQNVIYRRDKTPAKGERAAHAVENCWATFAPLGIRYDKRRLLPQFFISDPENDAVSKLLSSRGISGKDLLIGINAGASRPVNRWETDSFTRLSDRLIRELGAKVIIVGGPHDLDLANMIEDRMEEAPMNMAGKLSLRESAALFERCDVFVTGDTGPMHIAAAVGTAVVALFGAADPDRTGPVGDRHIVIQKTNLECVPCRKRKCVRKHECMKEIRPEEVFNAIKSLISEG